MSREDPGVGRTMTFLLGFGVVPATGLLIGGGYVGGWVLGEDRQPWATFAILLGCLTAFAWIFLATRIVTREQERRTRESIERAFQRIENEMRGNGS